MKYIVVNNDNEDKYIKKIVCYLETSQVGKGMNGDNSGVYISKITPLGKQ